MKNLKLSHPDGDHTLQIEYENEFKRIIYLNRAISLLLFLASITIIILI